MSNFQIVCWVLFFAVLVILGVSVYLNKVYPSLPQAMLGIEDEHAQCDCVGCGNSCCECVPVAGRSSIEDLWESNHYLKQNFPIQTEVTLQMTNIARGLLLPHNIVYTIIELLQGTNNSLESVLESLGFESTEELSLAQLLTIDDRLYRCNVCGYWSAHVNGSSAKYAALWKCPHCENK